MSESEDECDDIEVFAAAEQKGWEWNSIFGEREPIGLHITHHENGIISTIRNYNFIRRYIHTLADFHTDGPYKFCGHYDAIGQKNGLWISYSEKDEVKIQGYYKKGRKEGPWYKFRRTVTSRFEPTIYVNDISHYRNNLLHGVCGIYSANWSKTLHESVYVDGVCQDEERRGYWDEYNYEFYEQMFNYMTHDFYDRRIYM